MARRSRGRGFELNWRGEEVKQATIQAARYAIDETTAAAVNEAKPNTPVVTGTLQGSIRIEPAHVENNIVVGRWGSFAVNYAFFVEVGRRGRAGRNMLRNAADSQYPQLRERIRKNISTIGNL